MEEEQKNNLPIRESFLGKEWKNLDRYRDISDLFREYVFSGKQYGGMFFIEEAEKIRNEPVLIRISFSELPKGREQGILNLLKAFIDNSKIASNVELNGKRVYGRLAKRVIIEGTQEDYDYLNEHGCSNALSSGVDYRYIDPEGNFIRDSI